MADISKLEQQKSFAKVKKALQAMTVAATAAQNVIAAFEKTKEILIDENKKN